MHGETIEKARGQHRRFRVRPYGVRWVVSDSRNGRIVEFSDGKGAAVQLAAILNGQLSNPAAWRALEEDLINGED
jgi:hypothetical protein